LTGHLGPSLGTGTSGLFTRVLLVVTEMEKRRKTGLVLAAGLLLLFGACGGDRHPAASTPSGAGPGIDRVAPGKYLYLAGARSPYRLTVVDVDAGTSWVVPRPRLMPGDPPFPLLRRGNRLVYYGPRGAESINLNLTGRPTTLGGYYFIPSARPNRVWLAIPDRSGPYANNGLKAVREVTATGKVTQPDIRPPHGGEPIVALRAGLGIGSLKGFGIDIWNPRNGLEITNLQTAFAGPAYGNELARGRYIGRQLHLTDVISGTDRSVAAPRGYPFFDSHSAQFSPDGRLLAVPAARQSAIYAGRELALIDVATGRLRVIPGSRLASGDGFVTWASDGRSVFLSRGGARGHVRRIVVYRLGDRRAHRISVRVDTFTGMAAS
jgi:hypothetical protein